MDSRSNHLQDHIFQFLKKIPDHVQVCAAAKSREPWEINAAIQSRIHSIGMNYIQETKLIQPHITGDVIWSFLGKMQTNKIAAIPSLFDTIESVDNLEKLFLLSKYCKKFRKKIRALIEVNIANEPQKGGILPENLDDFLFEIEGLSFSQIQIDGLMTMGPTNASPKEYEKFFSKMYKLFQKKKSWSTLSMGMSDTWEIAIDCGANRIRLGTVLFGERIYNSPKIVTI